MLRTDTALPEQIRFPRRETQDVHHAGRQEKAFGRHPFRASHELA
jgi:hypothetical protein